MDELDRVRFLQRETSDDLDREKAAGRELQSKVRELEAKTVSLSRAYKC